MHVALHGRHDDLAFALGACLFFGFDIGKEMRDRLFHYAGGFHHLRQEHPARSEQVAHHIHAVHQRPFNDLDGPAASGLDGKPRFFGIVDNMRVDALDQRMFKPLVYRPAAPFCFGLFLRYISAAIFLGKRDEPLGSIGIAVEDDIFAGHAQFSVDVIIDIKLSRVDDGHIQPGWDGVIEKDRMHRPAHRFITTETE